MLQLSATSLLMLPITVVAIAGAGRYAPPSEDAVSSKLHLYSNGIWIDWENRAIELEARICLRSGLLELLACSPNTREHESILVVPGRPRDIYHAMGLVGMEPGSPVRLDQTTQKWLPPSGERLQLAIRFARNGKEETALASNWLKSTSADKKLPDLHWVFAGSKTWADGRFAGDSEGTLVAVVDFESALIAIGATHTADNASLWLEANTDAIPPVGTACKLVVSAHKRVIKLSVCEDGTLALGGKAITPAEVSRRYRESRATGRQVEITLTPTPESPARASKAALKKLVSAGLDRGCISVRKPGGADSTEYREKRSNKVVPTPEPVQVE